MKRHVLPTFCSTLVRITEEDHTWASSIGLNKTDVEMQYVTSFYWTIATMLAVGYGDVYAVNSGERIYSIVAQLLGAIVFGTVIGTVSVLVESSNPQGRARKEKLDELKTYMGERNIPHPLQKHAKAS